MAPVFRETCPVAVDSNARLTFRFRARFHQVGRSGNSLPFVSIHLIMTRMPGVPTLLIHCVLYSSKSDCNFAIFPLTENSPSSEMF